MQRYSAIICREFIEQYLNQLALTDTTQRRIVTDDVQ